MSFSREVREELAGQFGRSRHCQLAELAGMLEMEGELDESGRVLLVTENSLLQEKYELLLQKIFGEEKSGRKEPQTSLRLLEALHWNAEPYTELPLKERRADGMLLQQTCCKRAFLRGAFMAAGSISDPNKSYHFEIVCHTREQAAQLQELVGHFDAEAKIVCRKERYVMYLKEGSQIVDMLNVMEAYVSLMNLENVRILKEMRNSVNRKVNCETANIHKTVNAAVRQMEDIRRIRDTIGFEKLPGQLAEIAQARLDYPEATLKELGTYLDPPVGKSGVNHRLRKLAEIAETLGPCESAERPDRDV
ncbi:MAG: DNA-binding protein WhiA [Lachnospiraceae bacterium]|nr:DNA-binding protein WhiA [Lachnospiraceae bacterium]